MVPKHSHDRICARNDGCLGERMRGVSHQLLLKIRIIKERKAIAIILETTGF